MENKKKKEIFKSINDMIAKEINVSNVKYSENNMAYSVSGYLYKGMDIDYGIRKKGNIAICKITTGLKKVDDVSLEVTAKELAEPIEMIFTSYDGKYVFQKVISYSDNDSNATVEENLKKCITDIINMIKNNQEKFDIEINTGEKNTDETAQEEVDALENAAAEEENDVENEVTKEENNEELNESKKDMQDVDDITQALEEIEEKKEDVTEQSKETAQTGLFSKLIPAQRGKHKKRTKVSREDMLSKVEEEKKNNEIDSETTDNEETIKVVTEDNDNEKAENNEQEAPSFKTLTEISARLSQETVKDIDTMYSDVTKLFDKKSKEADERQNLLDKYAKRLKQQEIEIEIQKKQNEKEMTKKEIELEKDKKQHHEKLEKEYTQKLLELESNYSSKETELHEMEVQFTQRKEEIAVDQKKLDLEWKKLKLALDELDKKKEQLKEMAEIKDKLGITGDDTDYKELEAAYDKLQAEYNSLVDENNEIIDENDKIAEWNEKLKNKYNTLQTEAEKNKDLISKYKNEIDDLKENDSTKEDLDIDVSEYEEEIKMLKKERDNFKSTAEELRNKESENNSKYIDLDDKYKKALEQIKMLEENKAVSSEGATEELDLGQKAANVRDELAKIGVNVEVVVGAGDTILSTTYNECRVCINVKCDILYIEKPVKKPQKYAKTFEEWNVEDIRIAYLTTSDKVICKYAYDDVLKATKDTLDRMEGIA